MNKRVANGITYIDEPHSVVKVSELIPEAVSALQDVSPDDYMLAIEEGELVLVMGLTCIERLAFMAGCDMREVRETIERNLQEQEGNELNELIAINYGGEKPTVSGRALHEGLEVKERYTDWFKRMCEYGFTENKDYAGLSEISDKPQGGRPKQDHAVTIAMAKELCMLQRTDKGKKFREYFIACEEAWNSPEQIMARALQIANKTIEERDWQLVQAQHENQALNTNLGRTSALLEDALIRLDENAKWYSVKRMADINGVPGETIDWRPLKTASNCMEYEIKPLPDANYGKVNGYHLDVWWRVYPAHCFNVTVLSRMSVQPTSEN